MKKYAAAFANDTNQGLMFFGAVLAAVILLCFGISPLTLFGALVGFLALAMAGLVSFISAYDRIALHEKAATVSNWVAQANSPAERAARRHAADSNGYDSVIAGEGLLVHAPSHNVSGMPMMPDGSRLDVTGHMLGDSDLHGSTSNDAGGYWQSGTDAYSAPYGMDDHDR